jgi:hypothetical protein
MDGGAGLAAAPNGLPSARAGHQQECRRVSPRLPETTPRRYAGFIAEALTTEPIPLVAGADGILRVRGTRVTLETVVAAFAEGATAEEIACWLDARGNKAVLVWAAAPSLRLAHRRRRGALGHAPLPIRLGAHLEDQGAALRDL